MDSVIESNLKVQIFESTECCYVTTSKPDYSFSFFFYVGSLASGRGYRGHLQTS